MVKLCSSAATPKMAKSKTPKKSSAVVTPAKLEVKTPKQAKNTPAKTPTKTALQTPKLIKEALVKEVKSTPKLAAHQTPKMKKKVIAKKAKNTSKAAALTLKNGTASAKKNKAKTAKVETQSEDVEMESEGEESEEEEIEVKPKSGKSSAPKKLTSEKVGNKYGLFIKGLNLNSSESTLSKHFSQFGNVTRCYIPRNNQKKHLNKGFGYIAFSSQADLNKALAAAHTIDSRILDVAVNNTELAGKRKRKDYDQPGGDHKRQMTTSDNELFVARLNINTSKDTITEHFSKFGEVVSVRLPIKPNTSENKGFAFVAFKEASDLHKAMADTDQEIDSYEIVIEPRKNAVVKEPFIKPSHPNELYVSGLEHATQKPTLEEHFSKYGKVTNVTLPLNKQSGKNKGFGFVSFESAKSLESALEEDHEIEGQKISVEVPGKKSADTAVSKKVKAAPAAAKVEEDDENDEEDDENDEAEGEDEEDDEGEDVEGEEDDEEAEKAVKRAKKMVHSLCFRKPGLH